jgi:hypothetical protein
MAYFAENVTMFVMAMGGALLLVGIGFLVLALRLPRRESSTERTPAQVGVAPVTG